MAAAGPAAEARPRWALAVHGGAGLIERASLSPAQDGAYRRSLGEVAQAGATVLSQGGGAVDAVEAAVRLLEEDGLFNAGRGAVFAACGRNQLDASVMDGRTLSAGAVAGLSTVKHPISLARCVMQRSPHVMHVGAGAEEFARSCGVEEVDPSYFFTERRWRSLVSFAESTGLPVPDRPRGVSSRPLEPSLAHDEGKYGTVGAVALDMRGDVAAGTSTGGVTGKRWGRVGDSAVIGAGTFASNTSVAVSATGEGEYFIRLGLAREIGALIEHKGLGLQAAVDLMVQQKLTALGGEGGVIAVSPEGQLAWSFNTSGMYRAKVAEGRPLEVGLYKDET